MSKIFDTSKTIAAIATPIGVGGISIIRLSGQDSIKIADKMFLSSKGIKPSNFSSREMVYGKFVGGIIKDICLCVVFRAPNSFTGDDIWNRPFLIKSRSV